MELISCLHHRTLTSCSPYQEASAAISGAAVYGKLKFESGIHRVQVFVSDFLTCSIML